MNISSSIRRIVTVAAGTALLTVCSWISFGAGTGLLSLLVYILLGLAGLPVFAGFRGGAGVLLGSTGGYIIGFFFTAAIVGIVASVCKRSVLSLILSMAVGIIVCYAFGTAWFMTVYARNTGPVGLTTALGWCVFPYLIPDAAKILLAVWITRRLYPILIRKWNGS